MPLIITATDFTEVAGNAVNYACKLALDMGADILVMNCYSFPIVFSDMPIPSPVNDTERIAEEGMDAFMLQLRKSYPQIAIKSAVIYGNIIDAIEEYTESNESPSLVVIGNDYSDDNQAWMDSTLLDVFRNLKYPVLAVPHNAAYSPVRKIGFAYDNKYTGSDVGLVLLRQLTTTLDAELHVFYDVTDVMEKESANEINASAKTILSVVKPLYHVFYERDIDASITESIARYHTDWLAVIPRKHSFFQGLFHKSHTKALVNHSVIPILALHEV